MILVETESGGHLGWSAGEEAPFGAPWPDIGAMQFIEAVRAEVHLKAEEDGRQAHSAWRRTRKRKPSPSRRREAIRYNTKVLIAT